METDRIHYNINSDNNVMYGDNNDYVQDLAKIMDRNTPPEDLANIMDRNTPPLQSEVVVLCVNIIIRSISISISISIIMMLYYCVIMISVIMIIVLLLLLSYIVLYTL